MSDVSGFLILLRRQLCTATATDTGTSRASLGMDGTGPELELETLGNLRFLCVVRDFGGHQKKQALCEIGIALGKQISIFYLYFNLVMLCFFFPMHIVTYFMAIVPK
jgi:hypothetical protein